jgi:hypothetical protein
MNFLEYKDVNDMLTRTNLSVEDALKIVEAELKRLTEE